MEEFKLQIDAHITLTKESVSDHLDNVKALRTLLASYGTHDESFEEPVFYSDTDFACNSEVLWSALDQSLIDQLIFYIFNSRFSLTESGTIINGKVKSLFPASRTSDPNLDDLYTELDQIILWLQSQEVNANLIKGFISCIKKGRGEAVVRNQTSIHLLEWYKHQLLEADTQSLRSNYEAVKQSILLVIQDVWSAIRKACIYRFSTVVNGFTTSQLEDLFSSLIQICVDANSAWQSKEGAIMGVQILLKVLSWPDCTEQREMASGNQNESEDTGSVAHFVNRLLPPTVFTLLGHPQLSVREHTVKAYTVYIARSHMKVSVSCLTEVVGQLCEGIELGERRLPHLAITQPHFSFIEPYRAESLLSLCVYLVKHIPTEQLILDRNFYFSTFCLYLCHPASTVRQVASILFKFMVARESSNPVTLRYVLQGLCCDWLPDMELLLFEKSPSQHEPPAQRSSVTEITEKKGAASTCWEWREGRLLAYELIMQFLIKNHWLYTFGPHLYNTDTMESSLREEKSHKRTNSLGEENQAAVLNKPKKGALGRLQQEDTRRIRTSSLSSETQAIAIKKPYIKLRRVSFTPLMKIKEEKPQVLSSSMGASEFAKARAVTVSGHHNGKDYSCDTYNTHSGGGRPRKQPSRRIATHASSLLLACKYGGANEDKEVMSPRTVDRHTSAMTHPCVGGEAGGREEDMGLEDLATILERMFYQTVECLADPRWELRRMGQQLFPCLVEVIRWYDMHILEDIWDNQLKCEATLLSYGACLSLKFSLAHAARLQNMLRAPPPSWQDVESCQTIILQLVDPVRLKLDVWSQIVHSALQERSDLDKFTVVAMETLVLAQSHFDLVSSQKCPQLLRVRSVLMDLFTKAHPDCSLGKELANTNYSKPFSTPLHGYLSCCMRKENSQEGQAQQVEKYTLTELSPSLPHLLKVAEVELTHPLLPVLCAQLRHYRQEDRLARHLTDSILRLKNRIIHSQKLGGDVSPGGASEEGREQLVVRALNQLAQILATEGLDQHFFKQTCDLYASVSQAAPLHLDLSHLLSALTSKINTVSSPPSTSHHKQPLVLSMSNPPLAPIMDEQESSEEDEEEQDIDPTVTNMTESQTLNVSSHSGGVGGTAGGHVPTSSGENSDNSDWDSWDEEEEQTEDYSDSIKELFRKLQKSVESQQGSDGGMSFRDYVEKLSERERIIVKNLLEG